MKPYYEYLIESRYYNMSMQSAYGYSVTVTYDAHLVYLKTCLLLVVSTKKTQNIRDERSIIVVFHCDYCDVLPSD